MLEKEGIPGQIGQVDFVTNRVPKFFIGANKSPSLSKFTPNDVKNSCTCKETRYNKRVN